MGKKKDKQQEREAVAQVEAELRAAIATPPVTVTQRPGGVLPAPPPGAPVAVAAREVISRIAGSTLCYGEPVRVGDRAVIPAARVRAGGGMGFGRSVSDDGGGGGGGLDAAPVGFIDIGPEGASYTAFPRRGGGGALAGVAVVAAGLAGALLAGRRRR